MVRQNRIRTLLRYLKRSAREPEPVARGVGLGLFLGLLPSFGVQILLAALISGVLNANRLAAILGTLITNPITTVPLSLFSIWVGDLVLPGSRFSSLELRGMDWHSLVSSGHLFYAYLLGCLLLSCMGGAVGYFGAHLYFRARASAKVSRETRP